MAKCFNHFVIIERDTGIETVIIYSYSCYPNKSLCQKVKWYGASKSSEKTNRTSLKQHIATFTPPNIVNFFILFQIVTWPQDLKADFTLYHCFLEVLNSQKIEMQKSIFIGFNSC